MAADALSSSGLPPIAADLQGVLSDERANVQSAMHELREQQSKLEATELINAQSEPKRNPHVIPHDHRLARMSPPLLWLLPRVIALC